MACAAITETNKAPLVQILTWLSFFTGLFFYVVRQITRYVLKGSFKLEDSLITIAIVLFPDASCGPRELLAYLCRS